MKLPAFAKRFQCALWVGLLISLAQSSFCEIIPANRRTIWEGTVGVQGGIPNRTTIFQTLNPGATAAQINTAIANCPNGQVVFLSTGTYNLSGPINLTKSNVTLRGAGPDATILKFSGVGGLAYVSMSVSGPFNPVIITNWTAGYAQGATTITVASTSGFGVGHLVVLDQLNDPAFIEGGAEGATDSGNGLDHLQYQLVEITGINGDQVTFTPGLYMPNWSASFNPRMWNATSAGAKLQYTGIEDLKIDATGGGATDSINLERATNCWVKNIESIQATRSHIKTFRDKNLEIRDSWFHHNAGSGVGSYGILLWTETADLVENNIFNHISCALLAQSGTTGSVIGYNYNTDNFYGTGSTWMAEGMSANHNAHPCFNLFEGNIGTSWYADYIHGSGSHLTVFRNFYSGKEPGKTNNTHPIIIERYNRYMNVVGNILGTDGYHDHYEDYNGTITSTSAFKLGYRGTYDQTANDTVVYSTLLRHGNYDFGTHSQKWDSAITDHTLPNSLYLTSKPSWFGALAWPPLNPSNPTNTGAVLIPAGLKFANGVVPPTPTPTPTPSPTPAPTATPTPLGTSFPSTAGVITNPFVINSDTISQATQTLDPTIGGRGFYTFSVTSPGDYVLSAMVNCPDGGSNSLFVNIDGEPTAAMVWDIPVTSGSELRKASWAPSTTPRVWPLSAGIHQLIIRGREAGTVVGQITFSTAPHAPERVRTDP